MSEVVANAVKEAITGIMDKKEVRSLNIIQTTKTIFGKQYFCLKVAKVSHKDDEFTPDGDTFTHDGFDLVFGPNYNTSSKAFNIPASSGSSKIFIFTDQTKAPEGTVYVKDIDAYKASLVAAVKEYNKVFAEGYDGVGELDEGEEVI